MLKIFSRLPEEIKDKIICENLSEDTVVHIYNIIGKSIRYCSKFKKLKLEKVEDSGHFPAKCMKFTLNKVD